ncbi:cyclin-D3-3 [Beta vulgaris subsp. vulgaris]|uniref:cyclin-D3-3 n=1 Tax=Beta vulgaris subsp. vulgaris TaxID=3555 RepID=UPI0020367236|nr:cyclin-D3-3 [Beta vulgaris subsp. vulgaris]
MGAQSFSIDDVLYCQEKHLEDDDDVDDDDDDNYSSFEESNYDNITTYKNDMINFVNKHTQVPKLLFSEQDLYWENDELPTLLSKEEDFHKNHIFKTLQSNPSLAKSRSEAIDWMLKVHSHYSFSLNTAILAVNYFDRFMFSFQLQREKQWMTQLVSVACLSIAAKLEETHVPLLLDFQVEDSKYVFEAKTIQRMEILVLSTLQWKMNPVTSFSFLDYIIRRISLKGYLCWEFLRRCEKILLCTIWDSRFLRYPPSVMATATILHVFNGFEPCIGDEYHNQVLDILGIDKEKVDECCELILESTAGEIALLSNKRKSVPVPGSPNGVIDVSFGSDSSNDSWAVASEPCLPDPSSKKMRMAGGEHPERFNLPSVDFLNVPH